MSVPNFSRSSWFLIYTAFTDVDHTIASMSVMSQPNVGDCVTPKFPYISVDLMISIGVFLVTTLVIASKNVDLCLPLELSFNPNSLTTDFMCCANASCV